VSLIWVTIKSRKKKKRTRNHKLQIVWWVSLIFFIFMRGLKIVSNIYYLCSRLSFEPKVFLLNFDSFFLNCWAQVLAQVSSLRCSVLAESYSLLLGLVLSWRFSSSGCLFFFFFCYAWFWAQGFPFCFAQFWQNLSFMLLDSILSPTSFIWVWFWAQVFLSQGLVLVMLLITMHSKSRK